MTRVSANHQRHRISLTSIHRLPFAVPFIYSSNPNPGKTGWMDPANYWHGTSSSDHITMYHFTKSMPGLVSIMPRARSRAWCCCWRLPLRVSLQKQTHSIIIEWKSYRNLLWHLISENFSSRIMASGVQWKPPCPTNQCNEDMKMAFITEMMTSMLIIYYIDTSLPNNVAAYIYDKTNIEMSFSRSLAVQVFIYNLIFYHYNLWMDNMKSCTCHNRSPHQPHAGLYHTCYSLPSRQRFPLSSSSSSFLCGPFSSNNRRLWSKTVFGRRGQRPANQAMHSNSC